MKTPYYSGSFTAAQHSDVEDNYELRERMLEHRLAQRDDVRDIFVVTVPVNDSFNTAIGGDLVKQASSRSRTDLSWAMHWAIKVGDQYFELQRAYYDPTRTGLRMSKWNEERENQIHRRYRQGATAMTDNEIRAIGDRYFSRLNKMHINKYDLWCNNCQVAVDLMLRDIGGLHYHRSKLESLHEWIRQYFCRAILGITRMYYRNRGCDEEVLAKHDEKLRKILLKITDRSMHYPKRQWIREDIASAETAVKQLGAVRDHWFLTVLEASLSLRKGSENSYVRRGPDGKAELNFETMRDAVKGIFDDEKTGYPAWLKAIPWLTAGFLVGTPRWAVAVITIAVQQVHQFTETNSGIKGGMEESLAGIGVSPKFHESQFAHPTTPRPRARRLPTKEARKVSSRSSSLDSRLVPRYEKRSTGTGVPYYFDNVEKTKAWDPPDQQEMCLTIMDPPLSRRWEKITDGDRVQYRHVITDEITDVRPGAQEIWAVKKKLKTGWIRSTIMALPHGWELRRNEAGDKEYVDHKEDPPRSTMVHPMRQEIEDERRTLLPEWNVEWDEDRGKKYRRLATNEIRWKAPDGPQHSIAGDEAQRSLKRSLTTFDEPLPPEWTFTVEENGRKLFKNIIAGVERTTHPLSDKRKKLLPDWEMRYTAGGKRYWVHYGFDGRGTTWWTRNKLLKNTSLKNDACGWKLDKEGQSWEWFEGGDQSHSDIPVRDLDDPVDIEFREYPFLVPKQITDDDDNFNEPLPSDWVVRKNEDGCSFYWNFKNEIRSGSHPNGEERSNLPGLWEMRYTRHGRQYFIDHSDGSTWWTHPRTEKNEQKLRARPGQAQKGWKIAEDGKSWERFEESADMTTAEEGAEDLSRVESADSANTKADEEVAWRSVAFSRDWLKTVGANDIVESAKNRFGDPNDIVALAKNRFGDPNDIFANARTRLGGGPAAFFKKSSKVDKIVDEPLVEEPEAEEELSEEPVQIDDNDEVQNEAKITEEPPESIETKQESLSPPSQKDPRKSWTKRTSGLLPFRKKGAKKQIASGLPSRPDEDDTAIAAPEGLGLTNADTEEERASKMTLKEEKPEKAVTIAPEEERSGNSG
ncbi:uncharacterized protein KY384_003465 [Bacidia gigantensis]|uniref:uncharacterized protein n=1 Tax=Bacidia gigantensis TaxID=2732470 RepID=UPI001D05B724|nr:uncharacterized protein KY384_003465 [Bacidia gigantensis]KAG8531829.1 hypothetical protein KY384_003465 [Bacidia gigantensis]